MLVIILINEIHTEAWRLIWLLAFFTLCFQTRWTLWQGMIFFFFFRTHFTAAWVFLILRMQNGEKIKDFIIHFHFLTVKISQMGRISIKFSRTSLQFFKVVLSISCDCNFVVSCSVTFHSHWKKAGLLYIHNKK